MAQAAADLRFETAGKIKSFIAQVSQLGKGAFRYLRPLDQFAYVTLQPGPRRGCARIFLIIRGNIEPIASLISAPDPAELMPLIRAAAQVPRLPLQVDQIERIGIVAHHLFSARGTSGIFLPLVQLTPAQLLKAYTELQRQEPAAEIEGEGVVKELQAM